MIVSHTYPNKSSITYSDRRKYCFHNKNDMSMSKRLRDARKDAGYTQGQVADVFKISREAVALWESDGPKGTKPDIRRLQKLADLYKVSVDHLLGEQSPSRSDEGDEKSRPPLSREQQQMIQFMENVDKEAQDVLLRMGKLLAKHAPKKSEEPETYGDPDYIRSQFEELDQPEQIRRRKDR